MLEGVINRKTQQDDPDKGMNLPVGQIQSIEKTSIERRHKNPLAGPAVVAGLAILVLAGWLAASNLWMGVPGLVVGAIILLWGLMRLSGASERIDAFQIVAAGTRREDWYVVGSHHEVIGFVEGVRKEMQQAQARQAALKN